MVTVYMYPCGTVGARIEEELLYVNTTDVFL